MQYKTYKEKIQLYANHVGCTVAEVSSALFNPKTSEDVWIEQDFNEFIGETINKSFL